MTSVGTPEAEGPVSRPPVFFEQPFWTALGLAVMSAGPLALVAGLGGYVPGDDKLAVVVTGIVLTAVTVVVTIIAVVGTARDRRVWRDLDTAGVRVLGQVTSAERVWCGEDRCTRVRMLVTLPGRPPFTTSHLVHGEKIVEVGASFPVDVHPTRNVFRLADDLSLGETSR
ncbi:hypothetical protein SAMN04488074_102497 [Lentzea albidocapillata subsp. violacea]|uniref:Uncharacterized protein n=1 Tax=Lentzea albidocapillata subsp. violacea TaxID=128104 RepID=A0A1G8V3E2_9PSEU|nr:hypothetical protein SAMN04488074_102497 [Lentzea albidocapillata subsp. violacea]